MKKVYKRLRPWGYGPDTLYATSLCSDEVNRPLEETFYGVYGEHFNMGGLAGFPFAGVTGFGAMASHVPDGGFVPFDIRTTRRSEPSRGCRDSQSTRPGKIWNLLWFGRGGF